MYSFKVTLAPFLFGVQKTLLELLEDVRHEEKTRRSLLKMPGGDGADRWIVW